jgi:hypothetical protein
LLTMDEAVAHCTRGMRIFPWWASNHDGSEPDVLPGCAGDVPTLEALAAVGLHREHLPELKVRLVNVVDLMGLQDEREHPHGISDRTPRTSAQVDVAALWSTRWTSSTPGSAAAMTWATCRSVGSALSAAARVATPSTTSTVHC